jgi:hypothetical protein
MESVDENDAPFLAVGLVLRLDGIWTETGIFSARISSGYSIQAILFQINKKNRPENREETGRRRLHPSHTPNPIIIPTTC